MVDETNFFEFHCDCSGERLDRFLTDHLSISRSRVVQLIEDGFALVNQNKKSNLKSFYE